jgi:acetyl/propionyl-CoA carboxylase alpha subunit
VDVLGVPEDVVAPADGVIGASLVEPGDAVEYGQELLVVEVMTSAPGSAGTSGSAEDGSRG